MKKIVVSFLTFALAVVCACTFIGCGKNEENANKWSGDVGTLSAAVDNVIEISTGEELAALAVDVNGGKTYNGITVKLIADIDLDGKIWNPIGRVIYFPGTSFQGTFDGDGHTISNLKVNSSGMIQNGTDYSTAGLFGSLAGTIKNLNLKNVDVTSTHFAGALVGYVGVGDRTCQIVNCSVNGGKVTSTPANNDNGDKTGGIAGYCGYTTVIDGCTVSNITVTAYRDLGGIVGCADGANVQIKNCAVGKKVSVVVDNEVNYKNYTSNDKYNAGSIVGRSNGGFTGHIDCTGEATITLPYNE